MRLEIRSLSIPDVLLIRPKRHVDDRGFFSETYNKEELASVGIHLDFVQDNQALTVKAGTVRGLHFQLPPFAQTKLIRVLRGRILDVAVDIRRSSPTFGKHVAVELCADQGEQILIPIGFAHGVCTLEPNTETAYKVTSHYSASHDRGIRWNDPAFGIAWPVDETRVFLSDRDRSLPLSNEAPGF